MEDPDLSFENESIEAALQPFKQSKEYLPKLGDLISGMYFSVQFSILRKLLAKKPIDEILST